MRPSFENLSVHQGWLKPARRLKTPFHPPWAGFSGRCYGQVFRVGVTRRFFPLTPYHTRIVVIPNVIFAEVTHHILEMVDGSESAGSLKECLVESDELS